jgi:hypothetical protein
MSIDDILAEGRKQVWDEKPAGDDRPAGGSD